MPRTGLGEPGVGGHVSAGHGLGTGPITHRFLPSAFPSIRPTTVPGHICSDSLGSMLEIASMPHHTITFRLLHPGFKVHGPGLEALGSEKMSSFPILLALKVIVIQLLLKATRPRALRSWTPVLLALTGGRPYSGTESQLLDGAVGPSPLTPPGHMALFCRTCVFAC